jgi:hypothetical protein
MEKGVEQIVLGTEIKTFFWVFLGFWRAFAGSLRPSHNEFDY